MTDSHDEILKRIDVIAEREGVAIECVVDEFDPDVLRLHHLERPSSKPAGAGAKALRAVFRLGMDVKLACVDDVADIAEGRGLRSWYAKLGFVETSSSTEDEMVTSYMLRRTSIEDIEEEDPTCEPAGRNSAEAGSRPK